ncbi:MAG TPA: DUF6677 family protein, partial [Thermoanaerobaculia bacterium]|nr:DUF6677 family protein [Thermoanaerobaculia bacterium]
MTLAFLFPGAGHFYLGRRALAAALGGIVVFFFVFGLAIGGDLYTLAASRGDVLRMLAAIGSMGSGGLYFAALPFAPFGDIREAGFEHGSTFTLTAGLMNLLLVLDCWDRATGRKPA